MSEQIGNITKKLALIMSEVKAIGKGSVNKQQGFNFRGIDAVMNHLHPLFAKHGVVILPEVLGDRTEERKTRNDGNMIYRILQIRFHFIADDGSQTSATVIGEGMDMGDKAANKAMAVALKYALTQMLLLPYDEIDPDSETPEPSQPKEEKTEVPADDAIRTTEVKLGEIHTQVGRNKKGAEWRRVYTKADDDEYYSTFDDVIGKKMSAFAAKEMIVVINYRVISSPKGPCREIIDIFNPAIDEREGLDNSEPAKQEKTDDLPF